MMSDLADPFHAPGGLTHFRSTILWSILPEVIFFSAIATALCLISDFIFKLELASLLITLFGTTLGFVVSYRTSSAYERYSEGRKFWASVILASRTFSRITWIHVPNYIKPPASPDDPIPESDIVRALIEKKSMMNITIAFSVALKHYLRGEAGILYKDLYPLVAHLPKYHLPTSNYVPRPDLGMAYRSAEPESMSLDEQTIIDMSMSRSNSVAMDRLGSSTSSEGSPMMQKMKLPLPAETLRARSGPFIARRSCTLPPGIANGNEPGTKRLVPPEPLLPSSNPPPRGIEDWFPFYNLFSDIYHFLLRKTRKVTDRVRGRRRRRKVITKPGDNIPLELTLLMSGYIATLQRRKCIDVPTTNALLAAVQSFADSLTGLERILHTPIPVAYSLHLRHVVWLYLFFLPSQLHASLGWATVPAIALASFVFCGFLAIGQEIENPFGHDNNDLDLDAFTRTALIEINEITAHDPREAEAMMFLDSNLPFATPPTYEGKSAPQIIQEGVSEYEIWQALRENAGHCDTELRRKESIVDKS